MYTQQEVIERSHVFHKGWEGKLATDEAVISGKGKISLSQYSSEWQGNMLGTQGTFPEVKKKPQQKNQKNHPKLK